MALMQEPRAGRVAGSNQGLIQRLYILKEFRLPGVQPATATNFGGVFMIADDAFELVSVKERHSTAGSDGSAVTVMVKKVPSGTASSAGTDMLSAGISLKATADTNQTGSLSATAANTRLAAGDGVAIVLTGTPTAVAGVCVETLWKRI
jgi:hypothetical protein